MVLVVAEIPSREELVELYASVGLEMSQRLTRCMCL